ncbi:MAG: magnesium transporter MgtE N-terminal domain-containing protein [Gemmatimonadaceae bacterium]
MIKLIIFGVLGLVVGLGGGSAMSVMTAKKAFASFEAAKAKTVADSIATAAEHGGQEPAVAGADSVAADTSATDSTLAHAADSTARPDAPAAATTKPAADKGHGGAPAPTVAAHKPDSTRAPVSQSAKPAFSKAVETVESHGSAKPAVGRPRLPGLPPKPIETPVTLKNEKVSKVFGAMPAKDAAKVLELLDDTEVQSILSGLSDKQAAGILQHLPPARAAAISKLALRSTR